MGSFSVAVRTSWLTAFTGGASYSNAEVWVQLHLASPGASGTDNPADNATCLQASFAIPASGSTSNNTPVTWPSVPATETYTHVSLWSDVTGGDFLGSDDLAAPALVTSGQPFTIAIGELVLAVT